MSKKLKLTKSKKKSKWNLMPSGELFDTDLLSHSHLEIFGNKKLEIEGCEGIYEYTDDYLKLRLKKGALVICGNNFDIMAFENKSITVKGDFKSIEFCV